MTKNIYKNNKLKKLIIKHKINRPVVSSRRRWGHGHIDKKQCSTRIVIVNYNKNKRNYMRASKTNKRK